MYLIDIVRYIAQHLDVLDNNTLRLVDKSCSRVIPRKTRKELIYPLLMTKSLQYVSYYYKLYGIDNICSMACDFDREDIVTQFASKAQLQTIITSARKFSIGTLIALTESNINVIDRFHLLPITMASVSNVDPNVFIYLFDTFYTNNPTAYEITSIIKSSILYYRYDILTTLMRYYTVDWSAFDSILYSNDLTILARIINNNNYINFLIRAIECKSIKSCKYILNNYDVEHYIKKIYKEHNYAHISFITDECNYDTNCISNIMDRFHSRCY